MRKKKRRRMRKKKMKKKKKRKKKKIRPVHTVKTICGGGNLSNPSL